MSAADHGHERVVELLLQRGAEIDLQNGDCGTAMIYAAGSGKDRVVELLLQRGAQARRSSCPGRSRTVASH